MQLVTRLLRALQLVQGEGTIYPAGEPAGVELHHCLADVQAGFPVRDLRVNVPAHLQHVRVGAQGCVYQLQLFIRLLVVAQLQPALGGFEVH